MANLQCAARYSEHCPKARNLFEVANDLMLVLAQTSCVQGALSEGCSSIAVSSMEAILTNAFSADSACRWVNGVGSGRGGGGTNTSTLHELCLQDSIQL